MGYINCRGNETNMDQCRDNQWSTQSNCRHEHMHLYVECSPPQSVSFHPIQLAYLCCELNMCQQGRIYVAN
mgnify:FL=1